MAKQFVPTYDDILKCRAKPIDREHIDGKNFDETVMRKDITEQIFSVNMTAGAREKAWKFCKRIAKSCHCPVTLAEYKRMEKFAADSELVDVLLKAFDGYCPDFGSQILPQIVEYYYTIALISQSEYRRKDCLTLLDRTVQHYIKANDKRDIELLLRNMTKLAADHPDLAKMKTALENA